MNITFCDIEVPHEQMAIYKLTVGRDGVFRFGDACIYHIGEVSVRLAERVEVDIARG